jgi:hypothetical protein
VIIYSLPTVSVLFGLLYDKTSKWCVIPITVSCVISALVMAYGSHGVTHFCNYTSLFLNFQFITVIPFSLYYFALIHLEKNQSPAHAEEELTDLISHTNIKDKGPQYGSIDDTASHIDEIDSNNK